MLVEIHDDRNNLQLDKHVASAHEDYICDEGGDYMFCFNHKCKFFLYIAPWKTKAHDLFQPKMSPSLSFSGM